SFNVVEHEAERRELDESLAWLLCRAGPEFLPRRSDTRGKNTGVRSGQARRKVGESLSDGVGRYIALGHGEEPHLSVGDSVSERCELLRWWVGRRCGRHWCVASACHGQHRYREDPVHAHFRPPSRFSLLPKSRCTGTPSTTDSPPKNDR